MQLVCTSYLKPDEEPDVLQMCFKCFKCVMCLKPQWLSPHCLKAYA